MDLQKNIGYFISGVLLFILIEIGYKFADQEDLAFVLKPTDKLINLFTGSSSVYIETQGYYHEQLNILIDKSSAGFTFWMLSFILIMFLFLKYTSSPVKKIASIPAALSFAFFFTLLVNSSKIFVSMITQSKLSAILNMSANNIQEGIGILINLSFLVFTYLVMEKFINTNKSQTKLA